MYSPGVIFTRLGHSWQRGLYRLCPESCFPSTSKKSPQWFTNHTFLSVSRMYNHGHPACHFVLSFLILVHLCDVSLGSRTDFTVLISILSSTFDTPWTYFQISIVYNKTATRATGTNMYVVKFLDLASAHFDWSSIHAYAPKDQSISNYKKDTTMYRLWSIVVLLSCFMQLCERRSCLMVSASGPGSSPGWGHCVMFLGKTLYSHSASLHPDV